MKPRAIIGHVNGRPIFRIAGGDGRQTPERFRGQTPDEIQAEVARMDARLRELHQDPGGHFRTLDQAERREFDELLTDRDVGIDLLEQHGRIMRAFGRAGPGGLERAFGDAPAWSARRDDPNHIPVLGSDDSVVDYLHDTGQTVHDQEYRTAVLGALGSGNARALGRLARYLPEGETRDMLIGSSAGTATLTPDFVAAELIDLLRKRAVVQQLGARTVPMRSDTLKFPRITGDPTVSWLAEGATVTATDATLDAVTLTARRLTGLTKVSQELVEDSDPVAVGRVLSTSFGGALATEVDRVSLKGSGTPPEPQGVRNASGVSVNATAAAASWAVVAERVGVLVGANVPIASIGVAANTSSWTTIMAQAEAGGQPIARPPFLAATQVLPAGNLALPATGELYAGNFSELILGVRIALDFQVLRERYADEGKIGFLPRIRMDVAVQHGASFAVRTALSS
jgi:HK97 family phage major capsid protein